MMPGTRSNPKISYGHDIEGAWLVVEAAEVQGDPQLLERARAAGLRMAGAVYAEGRDSRRQRLLRSRARQPASPPKSTGGARPRAWWASSAPIKTAAAKNWPAPRCSCWDYIEAHFIDRVHGDWFKVLDRAGQPAAGPVEGRPVGMPLPPRPRLHGNGPAESRRFLPQIL